MPWTQTVRQFMMGAYMNGVDLELRLYEDSGSDANTGAIEISSTGYTRQTVHFTVGGDPNRAYNSADVTFAMDATPWLGSRLYGGGQILFWWDQPSVVSVVSGSPVLFAGGTLVVSV